MDGLPLVCGGSVNGDHCYQFSPDGTVTQVVTLPEALGWTTGYVLDGSLFMVGGFGDGGRTGK